MPREPPPAGLTPFRLAVLAARLALMLVADAHALPDHALGLVAIQLNTLLLDRLAGGVAPDLDENAALMALPLARLAGLLRSAAPPTRLPALDWAFHGLWAAFGLLCVGEPRAEAWDRRRTPAVLCVAFPLACCATPAALEPAAPRAWRALAFVSLATLLHLRHAEAEAPPVLGPWRFAALLPLLLSPRPLAWAFQCACAALLARAEWRAGGLRPLCRPIRARALACAVAAACAALACAFAAAAAGLRGPELWVPAI